MAVLVVIGTALWATTQWAAWRFHFHAALGPPLFSASPLLGACLAPVSGLLIALAFGALFAPRTRALAPWLAVGGLIAFALAVGPLYAPWDFLVWDWKFGRHPAAAAVFTRGHWLIAVPAHAALLLAMAVASLQARKLGAQSDSHGSARWAEAREIEKAGLKEGSGLFLAKWRKGGRGRPAYLRHAGPEHVLGFAPSRSGKGVGWVLPTLVTWPESVLVHDIKGENWALSAGWRQRELGSLCLRFDPTCQDGSAARYNPLLEVRLGADEVRDAQNIADMLVDPDGIERKDHWDRSAEELLVATILHVLYAERDKSLRGCLALLTDPRRKSDDLLQVMLRTEHAPPDSPGWLMRGIGKPQRTHPAVAGIARSLLNKSENERSSVISSAIKCLGLFRDEVVARNTSVCDFRMVDLMQQVGRRLTERMAFEGGRGVAHYRHRLLLLMDEFPALGRLDFFQTQLAHLAGYGIQAFLIVQDLSQLYAAYGRDESIVSNCSVRVAYAPNRIETARLLSEMAGMMTVHRSRRMYSGNRLSPWLSHVMASEEESQRPLVTPDEVLRLPEGTTLIFRAGMHPVYAEKVRYFEDPRLLERARVKAPQQSDRVPEAASNPWEQLPAPRASEAHEPAASDPSSAPHIVDAAGTAKQRVGSEVSGTADTADTSSAEDDTDLADHSSRKLT